MSFRSMQSLLLLLVICCLFNRIALAQGKQSGDSAAVKVKDSIPLVAKDTVPVAPKDTGMVSKQLVQEDTVIDKKYKEEAEKLKSIQTSINDALKQYEATANKNLAAMLKLNKLKDNIDKLTREAENYSKKKEELEKLVVENQAKANAAEMKKKDAELKSDSLDSSITEKELTIKEKEATIKEKEDELEIRKAELSKAEDSLEVIAKIELVKRCFIEFDFKRAKKELAHIDKYMAADDRKEARAEVLKALDESGFKCFRRTLLDSIINEGKYDSLCRPCKILADVNQVNIDVNEGLMRELIVKTSWGVFRNLRNPIDLVHMGRHLDDRLYRDGEKVYQNEYIKVGRIIKYTPTKSFNDLPYTQFNITLLKDTSHKYESYWIRESTSINSYFDVALFTDLKGISGDANGLAQITGNAKFIIRTANVPGRPWIWLNYISFTGNLAKFDKEFKGTLQEAGDSVNRKDLLQRARYSLGVKANIIHGVLSPYPTRLVQDLQLNAGYSFVGSQVLTTSLKDSAAPSIIDSNYRTVTHNQLYLEPIVSFTRYRNFNMALSLPIYFINLKESSGIANHGWEPWVKPTIELMYFAKKNSSSKLFFRYAHWINLNTKVDAFTQFQMGYSANLTELFQKN